MKNLLSAVLDIPIFIFKLYRKQTDLFLLINDEKINRK